MTTRLLTAALLLATSLAACADTDESTSDGSEASVSASPDRSEAARATGTCRLQVDDDADLQTDGSACVKCHSGPRERLHARARLTRPELRRVERLAGPCMSCHARD